jgi:mannose-6-phosphate isomerase-like protein (cupin superfamily)
MRRRVVTGHTAEGKSVFVRDEECPHGAALEGVPNFRIDQIWTTEGMPRVPAEGGDPTAKRSPFFPAPGGTRFLVVTFPPEKDLERAAAGGNLEAAQQAFYANFPGLGDTMDPSQPGMHTSQTVDYGTVIKGRIELELDDGKKVVIGPGDFVVQNGTRHAWRNVGDGEAVMAFVVIGANKR